MQTERTAATIADEIEKKKARSHEISTRLSAADEERDKLRADAGRAIADDKPADSIKKKLAEVAADIESLESGYAIIQADIATLEAEHQVVRLAAAQAEHEAAVAAWGATLDEADAYLVDLFTREINTKATEVDQARERVLAADHELRALGAGITGATALQFPQFNAGKMRGRVISLLKALRDFTLGNSFECSYGYAAPIDHEAAREHRENTPDWARKANERAAAPTLVVDNTPISAAGFR